MKTFRVYKHPNQGLDVVKVGFSWPAFFFAFPWLLVKRLWGFAGLWLGVFFVISLIENLMFQPPVSVVQTMAFFLGFSANFALWLVPSFMGNKWREENLSKRGYELLGTVQAETPDAAVSQLDRVVGE